MKNILSDINNYIENVNSKSYIDYFFEKNGHRDVRETEFFKIKSSKGSEYYTTEASLNQKAFGDDTEGFKIGNNKRGGIY